MEQDENTEPRQAGAEIEVTEELVKSATEELLMYFDLDPLAATYAMKCALTFALQAERRRK